MRVALVGAEIEENLALRYLWAALERAGHHVVLVVFDEPGDTERAAREIAASGATLAGLSMVFTSRARQFADLATRARALGFTGHLVAGGHFAAFHADALLGAVPAIDSVAIGEGEEILCALASSLALEPGGAGLGSVRGLVFRADGDVRRSPPACKPPDLDTLAVPPRRRPFHRYVGLPITNILGSRGCTSSCTFCSIVAWHRLAGGERLRVRRPEALADEMAALHAEGVRIFNFHDDNFFLPDRGEMLARVAALKTALTERGVGRIALAVKARPDALDEEVVGALKEIGLFRVFVGIEAGSVASLRALGRRQTVEQNERALDLVERFDLHATFNVLLMNPDSTLEDAAENVAFLRRHPRLPSNFCRTEIYSGTPLWTKLSREGRLLGDFWGWDYRIADERADLAYEIICAAFHERNYGRTGLHHLAMAIGYEHQLLAHFFGPRPDLGRRAERFVAAVNLDTCEHLEASLAACAAGLPSRAARRACAADLAARVAAADRRLGAEGRALLDDLRGAALGAEPATRGWDRTARAVTVATAMTLAAAASASCRDSHPNEMVAPPPARTRDAGLPQEAASQAKEGGASAGAGGIAEASIAGDAAAPPPDGGASAAKDAGAPGKDAGPPRGSGGTVPKVPKPVAPPSVPGSHYDDFIHMKPLRPPEW